MTSSRAVTLTFAVHHREALVRKESVSQPIIKAGKDARNHLRLGDDAARMHFVIEVNDADHLTLIDLGNEPTTQVNGTAVNKVNLRPGDRIAVGTTRLDLVEVREDTSAPIPSPSPPAAPPAASSPAAILDSVDGASLYAGALRADDQELRMTLLRRAADIGHAEAQRALAWHLRSGTNVKRDAVEAMRQARLSAEQGNLDAQQMVGEGLLNGDGVPRDTPRAAALFRELAERGLAAGQCSWGFRLLSGTGIDRNEAEAESFFRLAAAQWDPEAASAIQQYPGPSCDVASAVAVPFLRLAAAHSNEAGVYLATDLLRLGGEQEHVQAVKMLESAARDGFPRARVLLAGCLRAGMGVQQNERKAFKQYRWGAEQDDPEAQYHAGVCLRDGVGTARDLEEAARLLKLSEERGYLPDASDVNGLPAQPPLRERVLDPVAQLQCGLALLREDNAEGLEFVKQAAGMGLADAQYLLGVTLLDELSAHRDVQGALGLLALAAQQQHADDAFLLYQLFDAGQVVEKDVDLSLQMLGLASAGGHAEAQQILQRLLSVEETGA